MTRHLTRVGTAAAVAAVAAAAALVGCAAPAAAPATDHDAELAAMMKASFHDRGIATVDRLVQDDSDAACSKAMGAPLPAALAARLQQEAAATVRPPADGRYIGDWRVGEKLAQNGRGMTWTDKSAAPSANGANCYNCHQLAPQEISYGTLGPSLYGYGRLRGVTDLASPTAKAVIEYTWAKLYNAKAYNACSGMPRFGAHHLLDDRQLADVMALLLDPQSPVNR
ncbi:MAG: sulfur oxidation c-type cytochrome SoxX [Burkholderiales bacterium]|nr:sulfur oxidation c-type cytochrome SoxX [Burkholderiales bacterium]MDE1927115.1 sulfur oxidation c-type cytochrome SoxX [Burkholderiales bacterium]MDE2079982.1 sulfur oxidation c-type cytochrome SoxX [Burkholderiales bacterium]MDE2504590.1 sulfur oxidation c-type cytochrome SoxX [Burkholderiales bacterium]